MEQLKSVGFSFESASKAARIAAGNADLAIELLTSGVCAHMQEPLYRRHQYGSLSERQMLTLLGVPLGLQ